MDIGAFIGELLERENELAIPGLGSFYRSRIDGYYNKEQQQFFPPTLQLQFKAGEPEDDGRLVKLLAQKEQINTASARYFVEKYVANFLQQVNNEAINIGDLGTFTMRRDQLLFTPKRLTNNNELFYGLTPVKLKRNALNQDAAEKPPVHMPAMEKPSAFTAALLRGEPMPSPQVEPEQEDIEEDDKKPRRIGTWVLVAALIFLISGIGLICAYKINPQLFARFRNSNEPPPITEKKMERLVSDSIERAIQAQKDLGATPDLDSVTKSKILAPETPRDTFALVVATFSTLHGAQKELDRYDQHNINAEIRQKPNGKQYQIDVAAYFNIDTAYAHINEFKNRLKTPGIYIQTYPYNKKQ